MFVPVIITNLIKVITLSTVVCSLIPLRICQGHPPPWGQLSALAVHLDAKVLSFYSLSEATLGQWIHHHHHPAGGRPVLMTRRHPQTTPATPISSPPLVHTHSSPHTFIHTPISSPHQYTPIQAFTCSSTHLYPPSSVHTHSSLHTFIHTPPDSTPESTHFLHSSRSLHLPWRPSPH